MADQKALFALQPFILQAKSAGRAKAVDIITRATEAPGCFVFSELLELPSIQQLKGDPEYEKYYNLLRIFAYGSYADYTNSTIPLPTLSPLQLHKLQQLTLITISSQPPASLCLSYPYLLNALSLPNNRSLEDLVISAIYASLLDAKLDTAQQRVEVSSTAGRDVADDEIPAMIATLGNWAVQCEGVLRDLERRIHEIKTEAVDQRREKEKYEKDVKAKRDVTQSKKGLGVGGLEAGITQGGGGGGGGSQHTGKGKRVISEGDDGVRYEDMMDVDEEGSGFLGLGGGGRKRKVKVAANKRR